MDVVSNKCSQLQALGQASGQANKVIKSIQDSQKQKVKSLTQPTSGTKAFKKFEESLPSDARLGYRKPERRELLKSGAQNGNESGTSTNIGTPTDVSVTSIPMQPQIASSVASPVAAPAKVQSSVEVTYPWELSAKDRRVIELAKGLEAFWKNYRKPCEEKSEKDSFKEYCYHVVEFILATKKITADEFAKMLVLQEMKAGRITATRYKSVDEFQNAVMKLSKNLTDDMRINSIITFLAHAKELKMVTGFLESKALGDPDRSNIRLKVYFQAVDRFSKALWTYARDKKEQVLGVSKTPKPAGDKGREVDVGRFQYRSIGVEMLDQQRIHYSLFKTMEDFCKAKNRSDSGDGNRAKKKKLVAWTDESYKEFSDDLIIATRQLNELRYSTKQNAFVPDKKEYTEFEAVIKRYLRYGNHKIEDEDLLALIACYLKSKRFHLQSKTDMDRKLLAIFVAFEQNGVEAGMKLWNDAQADEVKGMREKIIEKAAKAFIEGDKLFRKRLEDAEEDKKKAAQIKLEQKLVKKGGKNADVMKTILAEKAFAEEERQKAGDLEKARDDQFFARVLPQTSGGEQEVPIPESPSQSGGNQSWALVPYENPQAVDIYKKQVKKKVSGSGDIKHKHKIEIKELGDEYYLTRAFVNHVRHLANSLADFQPKAVEQSSFKLFGSGK